MRPESTPGKLHGLLDNAFSSPTSFNNWLKPGNEIHLARLCIILNLQSGARALHIANSALEKSLVHLYEDSSTSLQEFRHGQENAKAILDTLKYVRASLERGITLTKSTANTLQEEVAALELSLAFVSECIEFWTADHRIYDPPHIRSFILKAVQFADNHPELFANLGGHPDWHEIKELRALIEASRKVSHETEYEHGHHLHVGSAIHHLVSSMNILNYVHHVNLPLISHHDRPRSGLTAEGLNLEGLTDATELTLHLMATWSIHPFESASASAIFSKISSEMTRYARAIDLSIDSAKMISNRAGEASRLFEGLSQDTGKVDSRNCTSEMLLVAKNALKDSHHCLEVFKDVRKAVHEHKLLQHAIDFCEQGKLVAHGDHELQRTRDVLEHSYNNVELYALWWTRMNMDLSCQENSSEQLLGYYSSMRKEQINAQWTNIRQSSALYGEKTHRLKIVFPDLFAKSGCL